MRSVLMLLTIVLILCLACGCSEAPPAPPTAPPTTPVPGTITITAPPATGVTVPFTLTRTPSVSDNTILIAKNTFSQPTMTVSNGSTVRWVNMDDHPHNIAFENKDFTKSTFLLGASQSFSQRFDRPGTFAYSCLIHPEMQGTIIVVP